MSTAISIASSRRRLRSMRQSLASSVAARGTLPWYSFSLASKRSSRAKASALEPGKTDDDLAVVQPADLVGVAFHDNVAEA